MEYPGGHGYFVCVSSNNIMIAHVQDWFENSLPFDTSQENVHVDFDSSTGAGILNWTNLTQEDNNTEIWCQGELSNGELFFSHPSILLIQGLKQSLVL